MRLGRRQKIWKQLKWGNGLDDTLFYCIHIGNFQRIHFYKRYKTQISKFLSKIEEC